VAYTWGTPAYNDRAARYRAILIEEADKTGSETITEQDPDELYDRLKEEKDYGPEVSA
jgi:hypothetical protein